MSTQETPKQSYLQQEGVSNLSEVQNFKVDLQSPDMLAFPRSFLFRQADKASFYQGSREFSLSQQDYDLKTYQGRFQYMLSRINPLMLLVSKKTILEAQQNINDFKATEAMAKLQGEKVYLEENKIKELQISKKIVDSAVHPDTQQIIPIHMRMSGFVVFNAPLLFFPLFSRHQTPMFYGFFHWLNQTYNAAINYGNRNASIPYSTSNQLKGYLTAVISSVSLIIYTRKIFAHQLSQLKGSKFILANAALNYFASSISDALNVTFMRYREIKEGVKVYNKEGDAEYGISKLAGQKAVFQTAITRFMLPIPILFIPASGYYLLEKMRLWPKSNIVAKTLEFTLCIFSLGLALPLTVSLFEQRGVIPREKIEKELQEVKDTRTGEYVKNFYFNKGL